MNLITGITGLVGAHLAWRLLESGQPVRGLYRSENRKLKTKQLFDRYGKIELFNAINWVQADICDIPALEIAFESVAYVYHCAAKISFDPKDEVSMRKTNIEGTANVVNLALAFGVRKLCHVSSVAALGDLKEGEQYLDEETEWNPEKHHSDYGISKYGSEIELWRAYQEGLDCVAVVPGIILGPGFWDEGSGTIFSTLQKGFPFYSIGVTGFVSVDDVVSAMVKLMESDISGERYIVIAEHLSLRDLAFNISDALQVKRPWINAGPGLIRTAIAIDWVASLFGKKRKLFKETGDAMTRQRHFSTHKIKQELQFSFTPILPYIRKVVSIQKKRPII